MRTILGSSLLSAAIAALLWIIISFATGAPVLFSLGGGIACGVVVFIIGSGIRWLVADRHKAAAAGPRLSAAFAEALPQPGQLCRRRQPSSQRSINPPVAS